AKEAQEAQDRKEQEEQAAKEAREDQGSEASEKPEDKQGGLAAYQGVEKQVEPREMTEQEAKMLLEGYKGEEATGRTIKMRQRPVNMPEPARDW
ncbi:MAG: hypothetical protein KJ994_05300, partial [Candidatus Omnitrophica bacterium]|nr:hypothetical protein [Candidatus Omnitrophota bacterium]